MSQCPSADRNNPMYQDFEDEVCAWCGMPLTATPVEGSWESDGFCDAECALLQGLSDAGIAHGMICKSKAKDAARLLILRAADELCAFHRKHT